jgi:hypothetical protein
MNGMIESNASSIEGIREKTARTLSRLDEITGGFQDIVNRAGHVRTLGRQSDEVIHGLDDSIRAI